MKLKKYKTLNYENLKSNAKKCLSPIIKRISNNNIKSNIKKIKDMFHFYNLILSDNTKIYNEYVTSNKTFMHTIKNYYSYKSYINKKEKHKKKEEFNEIDNLKLNYFKKGYKIPNFYNLFRINPLSFQGISIRQYFNELYKKDKKKISMKEKNIDYLLRLEKNIKNIKVNKNLESIDNIKSANIIQKEK